MVDVKSYRRVGGGVGGILKGIIAFFFSGILEPTSEQLQLKRRTAGTKKKSGGVESDGQRNDF